MNIKIGCDLVSLDKFKKTFEKNGQLILEKIFSMQEINSNHKIESLAGIFAAKEATIKALELTTDDWLKIEILKKENGKPFLKLNNLDKEYFCDVSISHDKNYAIATVIFLIRE